jgi:hypothetical protein
MAIMTNAAGVQEGIFRVNQPKVVFESFADETVLVNLDSGFYYSLGGCAGRVLALVDEGNPVETIPGLLLGEFSGDPATIKIETEKFIAQLAAEAIFVPAPPADVRKAGEQASAGVTGAAAVHPPFQPPTIEKFSDMQELLLLDPIHEVDEMGWPHAAAPEQG